LNKPTDSFSPYAALKIKEFKNFILGRFLFIMALRMTGTVIGWWVYQLTGSPLALGLVGLSEVISAVSLALYAGHYIDKNEKRGILLKCMLLYILCILIFLFLSSKINTVSNPWYTSTIIFLVISGTGAIRAFSGPTFHAIIAQIVPKEMLPGAASINSSSWLIGSIIGHASAGFLIASVGIHNTFYYILFLAAIGSILISTIARKEIFVTKKQPAWQSVKEGLTYVFKTKEILSTLSLDLFAVLFGGAIAMVPIFSKDILKIGAIGFGWLNAATDIGSIIMVTILTIFPLKRNQGKWMLLSVAGFGACIILFAVSKVFWLSFAALLISGCMDGVSVIIRSTIVQLNTPDELRGRVMAVNSMFINSSNELGQFESGVAAKLMGVVPSVIFGGCMTIGVVIFNWIKVPSLKKLQY
jgi:MFS family permease